MSAAADTTVSTFCRICEARCGIDVTVRDGRVLRIGPDKLNPYTWRDFCSKGRSAGEVVHHPRRLLSPLRRVDGGYERATWQDAVDDIATRMIQIRERYGPDAIAAYLGNPVGFNGSNSAWFAALVRGLGTANMYSVSSVDQNNLQRVCHEMYGRWLVPLVPDVDECDYFLLIGMNPAVSTFGWIHNVPDGWRRTLARQQQGAKIVLVDPNRTESTAKSDQHVRVWPGQDWALMLGVLTVILREGIARTPSQPLITGMEELNQLACEVDVDDLAARCRVSVETITSIAREFAAARTAMCVAHTGVSHTGEGVLAEWLSHVLNAVTGRLDAVGGRRVEPGYTPMGAMFGRRPARPSRVRKLPAIAGARSLAELADEITTPGEGQIKALICNSGNPVLSGAQGTRLDDALGTLDLMVAIDLVQRESHRHAHWLLPAAHYLEREDLLPVYSSFEDQPFVQFAHAAVEPPPGVRQEWTFWRDLALALDIPIFGSETASMTPRALWEATVAAGGKVSWSDLVAQPHGVIYAEKSYGQLESSLGNTDGTVHLAPEAFVARLRHLISAPATSASPDWPLLLSNQRTKAAMNSWLNDTPTALRRNASNTLHIHPDDAAPLGIGTGDRVRVSSRVEAVECTAKISDDPQVGVAILDHGWGSRLFDPENQGPPDSYGANRNVLVSDQDVDILSGTPAFGIAAVRVERLASTIAEAR